MPLVSSGKFVKAAEDSYVGSLDKAAKGLTLPRGRPLPKGSTSEGANKRKIVANKIARELRITGQTHLYRDTSVHFPPHRTIKHNIRKPVRDDDDDYFELLQDSFDELWDELDHDSVSHAKNLARFPDDKAGCDLIAAFSAIATVIKFLRFSPSNSSMTIVERRKRFKILDELRQALFDLSEGGAPAPMLMPQSKGSGRRADVSSVLAVKGLLAGLMNRQQRVGMSRPQAAKWIVDNMSPKLASRISRKRITPRMVEEWLDRFGGRHAEQNAARKTYLVWSRDDPTPLTKELFKTITERLATGDW